MKYLLLWSVLFLFNGCVMLSSSNVEVKNLIKESKGSKVVTLLNNTEYLADMSIALAENGFIIKPMPTTQQITELQSSTKIAKYNEGSTRWGITVQTKGSPLKCAFTDYNIHYFTLTLMDLTNNQVVMVLKQKGSDGPCSTVEPVFGTLAEELSNNW